MKKFLLILSVSCIVFTTGCSKTPESTVAEQSIESAEGDKVLIRLKPKVGDVQKTLMTMEVINDNSQIPSVNMTMSMDMKVTDFSESIYTYQIKINSVKANMEMGAVEMNYDSNNKEQTGISQMIHEEMKPLFEKPVSIKMSERGKVTEAQLPGMEKNKQMDMGSISLPLPEEPVGVGDSWTDERPIQGTGVMKMTMTIDKITVDNIIIRTKGNIESMDGNQAGDFTGNYTLARDNGFTKDGSLNINISGEGQPMKMKINFKSL